ncbi:MAG TPA: fumarylacetoacetate hydrolase family protein [Solirubrobacterales bacterium]|jgi:2-keto-4-pentenoate hydratase/2-oxohepta-3-ene-1,7-dioic acid hydratase in catechol pathway|nr:fumarylacetoacetate hydrolase family protein [Solirubrobacterales bacterium]
MRLVSYRSDRGVRAGVLEGDRVIDAGDALGDAPSSVRALLETDALGDLEAADGGDGVALAGIELLAPVPDPEKIVCIGLNYRDHAAEGRLEPPKVPTFFAKYANALSGDGATVALPASSRKVDYEAEVAFIVGRTARDVDASTALDHVAGYTLLNDLSARDLQFQTPQWMPGKVFDGSAPCGPALVTADEVATAPNGIGIALDLNGERMQEATTADLIFPVAELLAHLSTLMTLVPGDIVSTGTPAGVGGAREPRVWLRPGDEVVVSSPELGELRTTIA